MFEGERYAFGGELRAVKLRLTGTPPTAPTGTTGCPAVFVAPAAALPEPGVELPEADAGVAGTLVPPLQAASSTPVALASKILCRVFKKYFRYPWFRVLPTRNLSFLAEVAVQDIARKAGLSGAGIMR